MASTLRQRQKELRDDLDSGISGQIWDHQTHRENVLKEAENELHAMKLNIYTQTFLVCLFASLLMFLHFFLNAKYQQNEHHIFGLGRDFTALKDYASFTNGALVVGSMTTTTSGNTDPSAALHASLIPGHCWRISSSTGQLGVRFKRPINISNITIDHVSKHIVSHVSDAPRQFKIWGLKQQNQANNIPSQSIGLDLPAKQDPAYTYILLLEAEFNPYKGFNIQTYSIPSILKQHDEMDGIVLGIVSNWGHASTCLYRVRVHSVE
ncbi:hypothetical protein CVT24_010228 [Panaeolus cyanescens]|uniref:SUN domain-containing protein n=1 Tax=Panaeolus cyanescens TaxID=181874 RepID=A0A409YPS2_9AGAR|nr:hypothetical protein CVT24_010228 [Panaeolus cyanescens]